MDGVDGVDGVVVLGVENERDGVLGVVDFGVENDRLLPEEKLLELPELKERLLAAKAGVTTMPRTKITVTTRASNRRTQAQGRMVPLPSAMDYSSAEFPVTWGKFLLAFRFRIV